MQVADTGEVKESIYRKVEIPEYDELRRSTRGLDKHQKEVINIGVKYARDVVKARRGGNLSPKAPLLMVHGGAGAGKSTVINVLAQWIQKILQKEGDNVECPAVIKTSFTGTAASNIDGQTLHASFGFSYDNKHYSLSDKVRDQKRAILVNLKVVIIDEISMVKSDMLYQLDLRLQEITEKVGTPFGGVAIFAFGDMVQLKPVMGRYIMDSPMNADFKITHTLNPRWEMFQSITLETNHRQGKDKIYADLLNKIRVGQQTEEDITILQTRVRQADDPELQNIRLYIVGTRTKCQKLNMEYLNSLEGQLFTIRATHHHATQKKYKPFIEPKEGAVASTSFIDELNLKLGANVMLIHNINTVDGLTNGQLGSLEAVIKTSSGQVDKLIIKLVRKSAGVKNRQSHPLLAKKYPDCIVVERASFQYPLRKKSGNIGTSATVIQFPVKLAFAITSHKIQGQTIPFPSKVVLDIDSIFEDAQAHVMLSRAQQLEQVFILKKLNESKIRTSRIALQELERLDKISINKNPTPWDQDIPGTLKIMSLNCAGMRAHKEDIVQDNRVLKADIIHLIETSLEENEECPLVLPSFSIHNISVGKGKGITTFFKPNIFTPQEDYITSKMQISKFISVDLDVINVYRSDRGNPNELIGQLLSMISGDKATIISGDFNICSFRIPKNQISKGLYERGFKQLVKEPTHIMGGHIDHVYWSDRDNHWREPAIERHSPYYSDHDGIYVTLKKK